MLDYGVPGDSKRLRKQVFLELMTPDAKTGYMDGEDYGLIRPYCKDKNLSTEARLWLAFLYGLSYSVTTTIRFLEEFPEISAVKPKAITKFWENNKPTLWFAPDKRYLKNNDQVIPAIKCMYKRSGKNMSEYVLPLLKEGFDTTYKEITKTWRYFGPEGAYLFFDAVYGTMPKLYSDPTNLDWAHSGSTVKDGMAHLLCLDEAIGTSNHPYQRYDKVIDNLVNKYDFAKIVLESNLCFFRKLFKGTRYLGYYADRQLEECRNVSGILLTKYHIDIWDYREATTPEELRGEVGGWDGVRKERYKIFLQTGTLMGD